MNLCETCGTICPFDDEHLECDNYTPLTNEEWLRQCTTEQLEEELLAWWTDGANIYSEFGLYNREIEEARERIVKWLKEIHQ